MRSSILASIYAVMWGLINYWIVGSGTHFGMTLPVQFINSFLIYFTLNGLFICFNYYKRGIFFQIIYSLVYILPTVQLSYFLTYKSFLELQNISLIIREPFFLLKILGSEMTLQRLIIFILTWLGFFSLNTYFLSRKQAAYEVFHSKPFDFLTHKITLVVLIILTVLQIQWCFVHDTSQLVMRPFYPLALFLIFSVFIFLYKYLKARRTLLFVLVLFSLNVSQLYALNIGWIEWRTRMSLDAQFYRAYFGAYFMQTAFGDMKQDDVAKEKFDQLKKIKMDYNILLILNDTQRWDKLSSHGYPKDTDEELKWFLKDAYDFQFPVAPSNSTDTSVPSILTGLGSDQDFKKLKGSLTLWDYYSKTANTFFITTQDTSWSKLNLFYNSYGQKFLWSATSKDKYVGNPEDASDELSYNFIRDYLPKLQEPYVGVWQTFAPHYPYTHPKEFAKHMPCDLDRNKSLQNFENCYLNANAYSSHLRSELLKKINLQNTIVIMTADHGEGMGEHGVFFHGVDYHQEIVKVPLVIYIPDTIKKKLPEWALKNISENVNKVVSVMDVVPTLMHLHELLTQEKMPESLDYYTGKSLFNRWDDRIVFSNYCFPQYRCYSREILFVNENFYLIFKPSVGIYKIYETHKDLNQTSPLDPKKIPREKLELFIKRAAEVHSSGKTLLQVWDQ